LLSLKSLWGKNWKANYAQGIDEQEILRQNNLPDGSFIWNHTKAHSDLIHHNNFWEIKDGKHANFLEDTWQQMPPLIKEPCYQLLNHEFSEVGWTKVYRFWQDLNASIHPLQRQRLFRIEIFSTSAAVLYYIS
jgi:hypothetical protein